MSAIVTDQFRILNASNFVESVESVSNSYYVVVGLPNPSVVGFGRTTTWNINPPSPIDNFSYQKHYSDTFLYGKKITSANIRRIIRRIDWVAGTRYEIYRHDYSILNRSPLTNASRLYDSNYYVINDDFGVYICIDNGSTGSDPKGNVSQDKPTFTDLEPSKAGNSGDGYIWKYLFTVSPSDIIKFDSTEYITVPNNWLTSSNSQIEAIRESADSTKNENQIKKIYIQNSGENYSEGLGQEVNILGDGTNGKARIDVVSGKITNATVTSGGKNYSYGLVDLGSINLTSSSGTSAELIPIIPPSKGHGYNIYTELGTDKVLIYNRFDDSTKDFPIDTKFSQISIIKNPTYAGSNNIYTEPTFTSLYSLKFLNVTGTPFVGEKIQQVVSNGSGKATGYVASWDSETKVLKYFTDRSLYLNQTTFNQKDYIGISTNGRLYSFESSANSVVGSSGFFGSIHTGFTGISTNPTGTKLINLGVNFTKGLAVPEINKGSGEVIYLDNRPLINRSSRQKEDIKIVLEF